MAPFFYSYMKVKLKLIPLELDKKTYHLFVEFNVKKTACRLLLDTGASKTVFDADRIKRFVKAEKIIANEGKSVGLGVSEMETHATVLKSLQMGKLFISQFEVAVLPIGHVNDTYQQLGFPMIDGVLGSDFLVKYRAIIDYPKMKMTLQK
jgi:hypothetical protein